MYVRVVKVNVYEVCGYVVMVVVLMEVGVNLLVWVGEWFVLRCGYVGWFEW